MSARSNRSILIVAVVFAAAASLASNAYAGPSASAGTLSAIQKTALEITPGSRATSTGASIASAGTLSAIQKAALEISPGSLSASASIAGVPRTSLASLTPQQVAAFEISPGSVGTVVVPEPAVPSGDGFRWDDAGIGAAVALLLTVGLGTAVAMGRRRNQRLVAR
jgi:hypothetical protein